MDDVHQHDEQAKQKEALNCVVRKSTRVKTTRLQSTGDAALEEILIGDEAGNMLTTSATPKDTSKRALYKPRTKQTLQLAMKSTRGVAPEGNHSISMNKAIPVRKFFSVVGGSSHTKKPKLLNAADKNGELS